MIFTPYSLYGGGDFGVKIKVFFFIFRGSFGAAKIPYAYAQSNFKEDFFLSLGKKFFFFAKPLRPFVSVYKEFFKIFDFLGTLKIIKNFEFLRRMFRPLCAR
jgi:hypothetical protein